MLYSSSMWKPADVYQHRSRSRTRWIAFVLGAALTAGACAPAEPPLVISYDATPPAVPTIVTPTPRPRRPTRLPTPTQGRSLTEPPPVVVSFSTETPYPPSEPAGQTSDASPADAALDETPLPAAEFTADDPTAGAEPRPTPAAPPALPSMPSGPDRTAVVAGSIPVSPAAAFPSPPSRPSATPVVRPTATPVPPAATAIPGRVPEEQGQFVTSDSRGARYYYQRADPGWHRIHPDHRVWFLTAEALLRVFPDRIPHPTPTRAVRAS
ncbi:MAG: hypothetical protein IRY83_00665 [Chloroflexi bacterium]|nr:hypothetical protein [Chloroflexota bacterium]